MGCLETQVPAPESAGKQGEQALAGEESPEAAEPHGREARSCQFAEPWCLCVLPKQGTRGTEAVLGFFRALCRTKSIYLMGPCLPGAAISMEWGWSARGDAREGTARPQLLAAAGLSESSSLLRSWHPHCPARTLVRSLPRAKGAWGWLGTEPAAGAGSWGQLCPCCSTQPHGGTQSPLLILPHEQSAQSTPPLLQIRLRCQKGIPPSLRGRAWQYLSGSKVKLEQNIGKFDVSVCAAGQRGLGKGSWSSAGAAHPDPSPSQELDLLPGEPKWLDVIERDLHRQFPFHEMFVSRGGHG